MLMQWFLHGLLLLQIGHIIQAQDSIANLLIGPVTVAQDSIANMLGPTMGCDFPFNDLPVYGQTGIYAATASECANICSNDKLCGGFVHYSAETLYVKGVTIPAGWCYPKSSLRNTYVLPPGSKIFAYFNVPAPGAIGNFLGPVQGTDYPGNDLPVSGQVGAYADTAFACADICNAISLCVGFVYYAAGANSYMCYPKSVMTDANNALVPPCAIIYAYRSQKTRTNEGLFSAPASPALVIVCVLFSCFFQVIAAKCIAAFRGNTYELADTHAIPDLAKSPPDHAVPTTTVAELAH
jgi:hypothetical protein